MFVEGMRCTPIDAPTPRGIDNKDLNAPMTINVTYAASTLSASRASLFLFDMLHPHAECQPLSRTLTAAAVPAVLPPSPHSHGRFLVVGNVEISELRTQHAEPRCSSCRGDVGIGGCVAEAPGVPRRPCSWAVFRS